MAILSGQRPHGTMPNLRMARRVETPSRRVFRRKSWDVAGTRFSMAAYRCRGTCA